MNFASEQMLIFIKVAVSCYIYLCVVKNHLIFYDFWCMKSWGNLTAEDYKFAHLTCILRPHYLEKCKKVIFNNVIHICFRTFRLLVNKMDCHTAAVREVTSYRKCEVTSLCANITTESVTPLFDRLTHDDPLEFSPCLNQQLPQHGHNPHSGVHAYALCPRCDNPQFRSGLSGGHVLGIEELT